jgi:hypothetical protein
MTNEKEIRKELHRNYVLMGQTHYGSERWNILYATQQALTWVLDKKQAMSPVAMFKKFKVDFLNGSKA